METGEFSERAKGGTNVNKQDADRREFEAKILEKAMADIRRCLRELSGGQVDLQTDDADQPD